MWNRLKQAEGLFATCPSCLTNFNNFWCYFTCSPNQSMFIDVESTWQRVRLPPSSLLRFIGRL